MHIWYHMIIYGNLENTLSYMFSMEIYNWTCIYHSLQFSINKHTHMIHMIQTLGQVHPMLVSVVMDIMDQILWNQQRLGFLRICARPIPIANSSANISAKLGPDQDGSNAPEFLHVCEATHIRWTKSPGPNQPSGPCFKPGATWNTGNRTGAWNVEAKNVQQGDKLTTSIKLSILWIELL